MDDWPEPITRVQSLSDSGISVIPDRYIKPLNARPARITTGDDDYDGIPLIDLGGGLHNNKTQREEILKACKELGFFQVVNHGINPELLDRAREVWTDFFHQPMEVKQAYANSPATYEGYGSRLGVEKGAVLDWNDYYYLHYLPTCLRDFNKWPALPTTLREVIDEYSNKIVMLGGTLLKILSVNLGLKEDTLQKAFGGDDVGACLRVNFYPKCPQPNLTLGLSSHSDPGGLTFLLPDHQVPGLQVRRANHWITVKPAHPHAIIVNMGDQIQILSNGIYKSIEHRVIVNSDQERISLAYFYNPKSDLLIQPIEDLVTSESTALYPAMTFDQYRTYIRTKGPQGKSQLGESSSSSK